MTHRLLGIGTAVMAVALTAGVTVAQQADDSQAPPQGQAVQAPAQQPRGPGQMGPGQGRGRGQMGMGQQRGRGGFGPGQGIGPGRGMGPAGRGQGGPGMGPGAGRGPLGGRLDLTEDQQKAVQGLHLALRDQSAAIAGELQAARQTLHRETFADKRDAAQITALATKVSGLEKQLFDLRLKTETAVADLLSPVQREKMRVAGVGPGGRGRGPGGGAGAAAGRGPGRGLGQGRGFGPRR